MSTISLKKIENEQLCSSSTHIGNNSVECGKLWLGKWGKGEINVQWYLNKDVPTINDSEQVTGELMEKCLSYLSYDFLLSLSIFVSPELLSRFFGMGSQLFYITIQSLDWINEAAATTTTYNIRFSYYRALIQYFPITEHYLTG